MMTGLVETIKNLPWYWKALIIIVGIPVAAYEWTKDKFLSFFRLGSMGM